MHKVHIIMRIVQNGDDHTSHVYHVYENIDDALRAQDTLNNASACIHYVITVPFTSDRGDAVYVKSDGEAEERENKEAGWCEGNELDTKQDAIEHLPTDHTDIRMCALVEANRALDGGTKILGGEDVMELAQTFETYIREGN